MRTKKKALYRVMLDKITNEPYAYEYLKGEEINLADDHVELGYCYSDHDGAIKYAKEVFLND
jgi:hypothetical protein